MFLVEWMSPLDLLFIHPFVAAPKLRESLPKAPPLELEAPAPVGYLALILKSIS